MHMTGQDELLRVRFATLRHILGECRLLMGRHACRGRNVCWEHHICVVPPRKGFGHAAV